MTRLIWKPIVIALAAMPIAACQSVRPNASPTGNLAAPTFADESSIWAAALSSMSTRELCEFRRTPVDRSYRQEALDEIRERDEFTAAEIEQIVDGDIEPGMREAAVHCARAGDPLNFSEISTEEYDKVLVYYDKVPAYGSAERGRQEIFLQQGVVVRTAYEAPETRPSACPPNLWLEDRVGGPRCWSFLDPY